MFSALRNRLTPKHRLVVDYPAQPGLPNGATGILEHRPLQTTALEVQPMQFRLLPMVPMQPYEGFVAANPEHRFVDAVWLDGFLQTLAPGGKRSAGAEKVFLEHFTGQIFFLGTVFDTKEGPAHAFFNWCSVYEAGRYLCPVGNPVRPDVPVFAAVYQE